MKGFDHATFNELLQHFSPLFNQYKSHVASGCNMRQLPWCSNSWGQCHTISPVIALYLVLVWTRMCGSYAALQVIFGMTASNILKWLHFSKWVLFLALLCIEEAKNQNAYNASDESLSFYRGYLGKVSLISSPLGCLRCSKNWHSKTIRWYQTKPFLQWLDTWPLCGQLISIYPRWWYLCCIF